MTFDRIATDPEILEGKPHIRGLRITVETIVALVNAGWSTEEIIREYPDLGPEDVAQAVGYRP